MSRSLALAVLTFGAGGLAAAFAGCLPARSFNCESNAQCIAVEDGACAADGWCTYPSTECLSGRAYGQESADALAGNCVAEAGSGGETETETESPSGTSVGETGELPPVSTCGDGVVDPGETCDDGNRVAGDGCHPQCVEPGTPIWTSTYDGPTNDQDRGFRVALDESTGAIYTIGFTTNAAEDEDILLQRWHLADGSLVWTETIDGPSNGDDRGEHVVVDGDGNVIAVGEVNAAAGDKDGWIAKYSPDGQQLWARTTEHGGLDDRISGASIGAGNRIITSGFKASDTHTAARMQWYDTDGMPDGAEILRGDTGSNDAIDVVADGRGFLVTGSLEVEKGIEGLWTAAYADGSGMPRWEDIIDEPDSGNGVRGVGQGINPTGGSATAGVLFNDILVQHYGADGTRGLRTTHAGDDERHDEASDVRFLDDGSFIVVGLVGFVTQSFQEAGDIWVRYYAADGTPVWTDEFDGDAGAIDKALGVELTSNLSAVVVGYETVTGQRIDVWLRHYAI